MRTYSTDVAPWTDFVMTTSDYIVFRDGFPVNIGHLLFVPLTDRPEDIAKCFDAAYREGQALVDEGVIDGFNVGMNCGTVAGQTVNWPHIHMIPRIEGDMEDPTGGVRHVIPARGNYRLKSYVNIKPVDKRDEV